MPDGDDPDLSGRVVLVTGASSGVGLEIARLLGVTENVVEMQAMRGLRLILRALSEGEGSENPEGNSYAHERPRERQRD